MVDVFCKIPGNAVQQRLTCFAHTAADDHLLRIQDDAHIGNELCKIGIVLFQDLLRGFVTALCSIEYILGGSIVFGHTDKTGGGAVLLGAAFFAAAASEGFFPIQYQMADLTGGAGSAHQGLAVYNNATAHACAQSHKHHIVAAAALPAFAKGGHIGIVAGFYRKTRQGRKCTYHIGPAPAQIITGRHKAFFVHRAGNTDADTQNIRF